MDEEIVKAANMLRNLREFILNVYKISCMLNTGVTKNVVRKNYS